jgi:hypothetical protein
LLYLSALWAIVGCAHHKEEIPCYWAEGRMGDKQIATCVDSRLAEYYIENYQTGNGTNPRLDRQIDAAQRALGPGIPSREALEYVSDAYSCDLATLLMTQRMFEEDPAAQPFRRYFAEELRRMNTNSDEEPLDVPADYKDLYMVIVPGAFYESSPELNGDFAIQRRALARYGWRSCVILTEDNGSIDDNAYIVACVLRRLHRQGRRVVLISASRGAAEIAMAVGMLMSPEETSNLRGWINVVGVPRGTPVTDETTSFPMCILVAIYQRINHLGSLAGPRSMTTYRSRPRYEASLPLPEHMAIVNYFGIPLSGHIGEATEGGYRRLRKYGPNDGVTLVIDCPIEGHPLVPEIGLDHHMRDPQAEVKAVALARAMGRYLHWLDRGRPPADPIVWGDAAGECLEAAHRQRPVQRRYPSLR